MSYAKSNFKADILEAAQGEPILAVVLGDFGWGDKDDNRQRVPKGTVLSWEVASPLLDYNYDAGYGGIECHALYAWTETHVLLVGTYDGSSWVQAVPRDPVAVKPQTCGGG